MISSSVLLGKVSSKTCTSLASVIKCNQKNHFALKCHMEAVCVSEALNEENTKIGYLHQL